MPDYIVGLSSWRMIGTIIKLFIALEKTMRMLMDYPD